jgi:Homeodomain-like domain
MRGLPEATVVILMAEELAELEGLARSTKTEHRLRQRARIVLLAADGVASRAIGRAVGCATGTASKWRVRYAEKRLAGLDETGERGAEPRADQAPWLDPPERGVGAVPCPWAVHDRDEQAHPGAAGSNAAGGLCALDRALAGGRARRCRCPICLAFPARAEDRPRRAQILVREQRSRVRRQSRRRGRALHGTARERHRHLR